MFRNSELYYTRRVKSLRVSCIAALHSVAVTIKSVFLLSLQEVDRETVTRQGDRIHSVWII